MGWVLLRRIIIITTINANNNSPRLRLVSTTLYSIKSVLDGFEKSSTKQMLPILQHHHKRELNTNVVISCKGFKYKLAILIANIQLHI